MWTEMYSRRIIYWKPYLEHKTGVDLLETRPLQKRLSSDLKLDFMILQENVDTIVGIEFEKSKRLWDEVLAVNKIHIEYSSAQWPDENCNTLTSQWCWNIRIKCFLLANEFVQSYSIALSKFQQSANSIQVELKST